MVRVLVVWSGKNVAYYWTRELEAGLLEKLAGLGVDREAARKLVYHLSHNAR